MNLETDARSSTEDTELFVALVAALGTDVGMVATEITIELAEYGYTADTLRLSTYLAEEADKDLQSLPLDERIWEAMDAGDSLRDDLGRGDALALHAISDIVATREEKSGAVEAPKLPADLERHAFVLRSLKTPAELDTLRAVYGSRLVVIAAYSPKDRRMEALRAKIESSRANRDDSTWAHLPDALIARDEKEEQQLRGQDVRGTFHRADFFIRGSDRGEAQRDIERTLAILFGSPFRTPTRDEQGQFLAAGAALRSSEFGRQVGVAIVTDGGSILAVGTNEVPEFPGGSHWEEDGPGNRDFEIGDIDTNRKHVDDLAAQLARRVDLRVAELIETEVGSAREKLDRLRTELSDGLSQELRSAGLKDLTEFGRAVHAEMSALLDAALRGVSIEGGTLHTTTFPCHNCARHIVAGGIKRVVFIEPYTKSKAQQLHADSIALAASEPDPLKVNFEPFVGVAPRRYLEMFDAENRERLGHVGRKDGNGVKSVFEKKLARPVFSDASPASFRPDPLDHRVKELVALDYLDAESNEAHRKTSGD